jgi:hypothetical protein
MSAVNVVLECFQGQGERQRDLPPGVVVYFVIALSLFPGDSEITLSRKMLTKLNPGMLCLADRLFPGLALWRLAAATGSFLLWRAKTSLTLEYVESLEDGSWLARWHPDKKVRKSVDRQAELVRVVEYRLREKRGKPGGELYRLVTNILDPKIATAKELAELYPERWEVELCIKETKTILRKGKITLRSKRPELVEQEFWGMLLAHYAVRRMMAQAALDRKRDPDKLSYQGAKEIIKHQVAGPVLFFPPSG